MQNYDYPPRLLLLSFLFLNYTIVTTDLPYTHNKTLSYYEITELTKRFFKESAGGDPYWVMKLLKQYPTWATLQEVGTGNTALFLAIKNYSGTKAEDKLIAMLITLAPKLVLISNDAGTTIFDAIENFMYSDGDFIARLRTLITRTLASIKIDYVLTEKYRYLLIKKYYIHLTALFMECPYIMYHTDGNNKTLLEYCEEIGSPLDIVKYYIKKLQG